MSYIVETCPHCGNEIQMLWDVVQDGYKAFCPVCGGRLMLCDECQHRGPDGEYKDDCDYCMETDTCRYNMDRIAMIKAKRAWLDQDAINKKNAEEKMRAELVEEIHARKKRIQDILDVARALYKNKFDLPFRRAGSVPPLEKYGYPYGVMADAIYHGIGIWTDPRHTRFNLAILMGGACGHYDFHTDGDSVDSYDPQYGDYQPVPIKHLQQFLKEFDQYERAFYAWVDDEMSIK